MQENQDNAPEGAEHRIAFRLLLDHAAWPTPPAAWVHLFMATAALGEICDPAPPSAEGRKSAAAFRLLVRVLEEGFWGMSNNAPLRAFLPLVQGRSRTIEAALNQATTQFLDQPVRTGPDGATILLEILREDRTSRMVRGLTKGMGADAADEARPELAENLRNPYELAEQLDRMRDRIIARIVELIRTGDPALRLMDRMAIAVPLAEASTELRGSGGLAPADLRIRMTDLTLMNILELLGPDLGESPVNGAPAPRKRPVSRRAPVVSDVHNPYRLLQQTGFRSRPLGESLTRIRDHVRSVLSGDIVPMGRRRLPVPANVDTLARTLRRIQSGA